MSESISSDIVWHPEAVTRIDRERQLRQKGTLVWLTGLSGSGKSTIAQALVQRCHAEGHYTVSLDGDNIRHGLCSDLGFSADDRQENIRRISEVARLFVEHGAITITAFISPFREDRAKARNKCTKEDFIEVFVDCPFEVCAKRDPKGLYAKMNAGDIKNFTGVDSNYEAPENAEIQLHSDKMSIDQCVEIIYQELVQRQRFHG